MFLKFCYIIFPIFLTAGCSDAGFDVSRRPSRLVESQPRSSSLSNSEICFLRKIYRVGGNENAQDADLLKSNIFTGAEASGHCDLSLSQLLQLTAKHTF